jgi:hypothetical protein
MASTIPMAEKVNVTLRQAAGMINRTAEVYLGMTTLVTMRITKKQARTVLRGLRQQGASGVTLLVDAESVRGHPQSGKTPTCPFRPPHPRHTPESLVVPMFLLDRASDLGRVMRSSFPRRARTRPNELPHRINHAITALRDTTSSPREPDAELGVGPSDLISWRSLCV